MTERSAEIVALREQGLTFTDIGKMYGLGLGRVSEIYKREVADREWCEKHGPFLGSLSKRTRNSLRRAGICTEEDLHNFAEQRRHIRNVGQKTVDEINSVISWKIKLARRGDVAVICLEEDNG